MAAKEKNTTKRARRGGRKKIVWNEGQWNAFRSMCIVTNKRHRVAKAMGNDEKTINRIVKEKLGISFSEYIEKRFDEGNLKLLAKQYEVAMSGDRTMLIWLGKNRLGQSDKTEMKDTTETIEKIAVEHARIRLDKLINAKAKIEAECEAPQP